MHWLPAAQALLPPAWWSAAVRGAMGLLFGWSLRKWPQDPSKNERLCRHVASSAGTALLAHWFQTIAHGGLVTRDPAELRAGAGGGTDGCWGVVSLPLSVRRVPVPVMAVAGGADRFVDVPSLEELLPEGSRVLVVPEMEHLDLVWGSSAGADVFPAVCDFLAREGVSDEGEGQDVAGGASMEGSRVGGERRRGADVPRGVVASDTAPEPVAAGVGSAGQAVTQHPPAVAAVSTVPAARAAVSTASTVPTVPAVPAAFSTVPSPASRRDILATSAPLPGRATATPGTTLSPPPADPRRVGVSGAAVAARFRQEAAALGSASMPLSSSVTRSSAGSSGASSITRSGALRSPTVALPRAAAASAEASSDPVSAGSSSPTSRGSGSAVSSPGSRTSLSSYFAGALAATTLAAAGGGSGSAHYAALLLSAGGSGHSPPSGHSPTPGQGVVRAMAPVTPPRPEDAGTGSTWSRRTSDAGRTAGLAGSARRRLAVKLGTEEVGSSAQRGNQWAPGVGLDAGDPR